MTAFLNLSQVAVSPSLASDAPFRAELWGSIAPVYQAILKHPFLLELQTGRLPRQSFRFYLIQDLQYLGAFSRALEYAAAKAPMPEWAEILRRHARGATESEGQLHRTILENYGITQDRIRSAKMAPANFAYTNFLVATACSRPFPEILAALSPCYWVYLEVGKELKKKGSRDKTYQLWIDTYSSPGYERDVEEFLSILDASARGASDEERSRMREHFDRASRYEWMFWDMAYRLESWPPKPRRGIE